MVRMKLVAILALTVAMVTTLPAAAEKVGEVGVDWLRSDIIVEDIADPKVQGVTCHVAYFERGLVDRLKNGNWFEDPSNSSIACRQTRPISVGDIDRSEDGENVFRQRHSFILKSVNVRRIYDEANKTLIYLAHARQVKDGAAEMLLSVVPLYNSGAQWKLKD